MIEKIEKLKNKDCITFLTTYDLKSLDSLNYTLGNTVVIEDGNEDKKISDVINSSKIKKIYLFGNNDFYRFLLPRLKKGKEICWIFNNSFSALSNAGVRFQLHSIFEFYERSLINSIGCISKSTEKVIKNAGYNCEYIDLQIKRVKKISKKSNSIGILSDDFDPNNNFYNQLAALTFLDYEECKFMYVMRSTKEFIKFFNLKCKKVDNIDDAMKDNFVNLYINFTNTNNELIIKSFNLGIPCIVGNTDFFIKNKYLQENLVIKSDDDVNEIANKINFVRENKDKILKEYSKL